LAFFTSTIVFIYLSRAQASVTFMGRDTSCIKKKSKNKWTATVS